MSTPFPLEEQAQLDPARPAWNPWNGPADPHWYSGMGFGDDTAHLGPLYQLATGIGSGAEKGAALLMGLYGREASTLADVTQTLHIPGSAWLRGQSQELGDVGATARDNAKRLTPDPATTGTAAQTLNGLASGVTRYVLGSVAAGPIGGAAAVGSTEAMSRYQDLREQGVDEETARASAGLAGIAGAAGAFVPGGWGSTLASRLASGAAANVGFGAANRYLDHKILEDGGYHEMADQQRALDSTQLLTDTVLGMGFGGLAHLHARAEEARVNAIPTWTPTPREVPGVEDAALTANLALRDRAAAPGVPVDPAAANAHSAAMEKATADLLQGNPVDVSGTGVDQGNFLRRPAPDTTEPENMLVNVLKESGILDEERNLQELEAAMGRRLRGEREPESAAVQASAESGRPVDVDSLTDPDHPVTLYRGEDKGNVQGGEWWTTNRAQAKKYGQVQEVTLPAGVVARNSVRGHGGPHERVFPTEGSRPLDLARAEEPPTKSATIAKIDAPSGVLDEAHAQHEKGNYEAVELKDGTEAHLVHIQSPRGGRDVVAFNTQGERIGRLSYETDASPDGRRWNPDVHVEEQYRRRGLATKMYDAAEARGGLIPDVDQKGQVRTEAGQAFREARAGRPVQTPAEAPVREPPIAQFRRDAADIEQGLPPVASDKTRLWRGGVPGEQGATRFTNDLPGIALPFRKAYGGEVHYVDVPTSRLAEFEDRVGAAPGAEFRLPPELAAMSEVVREDRPESVTLETPPEEEGYTVGEQELTDEQKQAFERLAHPADQVLQEDVGGSRKTGERGIEDDGGRGGLGESRGPTRVYRGGRGGALTPEHFEPATLGRATGHPSSGLGVYFTNDSSDAARYGTVTEHDLTLQNPKRIPIEELPGFDTLAEAAAYREKLRAEGHDGIVLDSSHLGGPKHYVAFDQGGVKPVPPEPTTQMMAERPGMQIPDEDGNLQPAEQAIQQADADAARGEQEAPKATQAAINCFLRKGG